MAHMAHHAEGRVDPKVDEGNMVFGFGYQLVPQLMFGPKYLKKILDDCLRLDIGQSTKNLVQRPR
jgi:hypothetical protein